MEPRVQIMDCEIRARARGWGVGGRGCSQTVANVNRGPGERRESKYEKPVIFARADEERGRRALARRFFACVICGTRCTLQSRISGGPDARGRTFHRPRVSTIPPPVAADLLRARTSAFPRASGKHARIHRLVARGTYVTRNPPATRTYDRI